MALDELLLDRLSVPGARPATFLRFYQWDRPTLSLGFAQRADRFVNFEFCRCRAIPVVRRLTGGRAVLHDCELTYAVVSNDPALFPISDISATYQKIGHALRQGLQQLGLQTEMASTRPSTRPTGGQIRSTACFASTNHQELLLQGRKLVGSAQRRKKSAFLQHGSILVRFNSALLAGALGIDDIQSLESQVIDLERSLGEVPDFQQLIEALVMGFQEGFLAPLQYRRVDSCLVKEAQSLAERKYAVLDW
jgi:lipoate-protein ligase A